MKLDIKDNLNSSGKCCYFEHNGQRYYADRATTWDAGLETMIFPCDEEGFITSWGELYCDHSGKSLEECVDEFIKSL